MSIGAAIVVILVGLAIAAWVNGTIGLIVTVVGVIGLVWALVTGMRARA